MEVNMNQFAFLLIRDLSRLDNILNTELFCKDF